jgi:NAD dependent epimerase/dehydratase family
MKTVLVTGSHACKALSRAGYMPVVFDNLKRGHDWAVKWGPLERGELRNEQDLQRAFKAHRPCAVMHFAAYAYVGESTAEPTKYYDNNVGGTAKLLQACAAFECMNIVFSSSCATYGVPVRLPLVEDAAQNPVNPYGYTKLVVERMLKEPRSRMAFGMWHFAISMRQEPTPTVSLESITSRKPISSPWCCSRRWAASRQSRSSGMTMLRRMAPASVITCMSATSPTRMSPQSTGFSLASRAIHSISVMAVAPRSPRS